MKWINYIESLLYVILVISLISTRFELISHMEGVSVLSAFILGILYFPLGIFTLKKVNNSMVDAAINGFVFSVVLVALIFNIMKIDLYMVFLLVALIIYLTYVMFYSFTEFFLKNQIKRRYEVYRGIALVLITLLCMATY